MEMVTSDVMRMDPISAGKEFGPQPSIITRLEREPFDILIIIL